MKATIRELMGIRVNGVLFLLACLLLAGVGVAAKRRADELALMADELVLEVGHNPLWASTPVRSPTLEEKKRHPERVRAPAALTPAPAPLRE